MAWTWTRLWPAPCAASWLSWARRRRPPLPPPAAARLAKAAKATTPKKRPKPGLTVTVMVMNSRPANLAELQATVSGSEKFKKVLGKLKAGKQAAR